MSRAWLAAALVIVGGCGGSEESEPSEPAAPPTATAPASTSAPPSTTAPPTTGPSTSVATTTTGVTPAGFDPMAAQIIDAAGQVCAVCLWVAGSPEQRGRGLMGVTDLGGADGMVFVFDDVSTSAFWMRDTPMPLSIAFFDAGGTFVSATDMDPCVDGAAADCPRYRATGPYATALEVPAGRLSELLVAPGSRLVLLDQPCDPRP